jgi:hypothetical protein
MVLFLGPTDDLARPSSKQTIRVSRCGLRLPPFGSIVTKTASSVFWRHCPHSQLGIRIRRLLTDRGPCYKSRAFRASVSSMASAPAPTHHVPTARPNSLFKLRCASERNAHYSNCAARVSVTLTLIPLANTANDTCLARCFSTTAIDPRLVWVAFRRSAALPTIGTPC